MLHPFLRYEVGFMGLIGHFWNQIGRVYIIPALMCGCTLLLGRWIDFYPIDNMLVGIVLYTAIYCALSWFLVFNGYEKSLIKEPILRLLKRRK